MSFRRAKSAPKMFETNPEKLQSIVLNTMKRVSDAVGSTLGPNGRLVLIESDLPGIDNRPTKDGITVYKSLGSANSYEHLIIETARSASARTATEAGDGTTTSTVLSYAIIENLFKFTKENPRYSPQKAARRITKVVKDSLVPYIEQRAIKIDLDNQHLLRSVARISANGDDEMADAVIEAFDQVGFGASSHVTIREVPGPNGYKVEKIEGLPIPMGYEESIGKQAYRFINDQGNQRIFIKKPLFILFDGAVNDLVGVSPLIEAIGQKFVESKGDEKYQNIVLVAHAFSESVINSLAYNFEQEGTTNVVPLRTPMAQFINSQTQFLHDLAAFTGARVFGLKDQIETATMEDIGFGMESFECGRFRSTVIGDSDGDLISLREADMLVMLKNAESEAETNWIKERIGKLTQGIAKLTVYAGSTGEIKEKVDRVDDAVCAVRSAISYGALPGGCRLSIDMALKLTEELPAGDPAREVLVPALLSLPYRLLDNAGYTAEEQQEVLKRLINDRNVVYDIENERFGAAEELGLYDSTKAVQESLINAVSIAGVLGTMGAIVCHPRDAEFERKEAMLDSEFYKVTGQN